MKEPLQLENYYPEDIRKELEWYAKLLTAEFEEDRRRESITSKTFLEMGIGRDWENQRSMLLLLHGHNEHSTNTRQSWLSPVATGLALDLLDSSHSVAIEACQRSSTYEKTLSRLMYQLLERRPALIRRTQDYKDISSLLLRVAGSDDKLPHLQNALSRIINLHEDRVYIIVDRPELCARSCARFISAMLHLVKEATTELKILLVIRDELWDYKANADDIDLCGIENSMFRQERLDQGRR